MATICTITTKSTRERLTLVFRHRHAWKVRMAIGTLLVRCAARAIGTSCEIEIINKRDS